MVEFLLFTHVRTFSVRQKELKFYFDLVRIKLTTSALTIYNRCAGYLLLIDHSGDVRIINLIAAYCVPTKVFLPRSMPLSQHT